MIGNILDNTTELYMIKYIFGEIFSSGGAILYKNPSDQTVEWGFLRKSKILANRIVLGKCSIKPANWEILALIRIRKSVLLLRVNRIIWGSTVEEKFGANLRESSCFRHRGSSFYISNISSYLQQR